MSEKTASNIFRVVVVLLLLLIAALQYDQRRELRDAVLISQMTAPGLQRVLVVNESDHPVPIDVPLINGRDSPLPVRIEQLAPLEVRQAPY